MLRKVIIIFLFTLLLPVFSSAGIDYASIEHSIVVVDFSRISEHRIITVDSSIADWRGQLPVQQNSAVYSSNEYIWYDASGDDLGDGDYTYPLTNALFTSQSADIKQFRAAYSNNYLYLYIETWGVPGIYWVPSMIVGIETGSPDSGLTKFINGDGLDPNSGPAAEIGCEKMMFDYVIYACKTEQCRLWNVDGQMTGSRGFPGAANNIQFDTAVVNMYEIGIPFSLIGNPVNKKWHFIVGSGFNEGYAGRDIMREIYPPFQAETWHGSGGDTPRKDDLGPDPDVYDLIGAERSLQEQDLSDYPHISFNSSAEKGESLNFSVSPNPLNKEEEDLQLIFTLKIKTEVSIRILNYTGKEMGSILDEQVYEATEDLTYYSINYTVKDKEITPGLYFIQAQFKTAKGNNIVNKLIRIY